MPLLVCPLWMLTDVLMTLSDGFDQYADYVTTLLHFDGADGSTDFIEQSSAKQFVVRSGSPNLSTTQKKFGSSSLYLVAGDSIRSSYASADFNIVNSDFTVEIDVMLEAYNPTASNGMTIASNIAGTSGSGWSFGINGVNEATGLSFLTFNNGTQIQNASVSFPVGNPLTLNEWHHLAVSKKGSTYYFFIDGVLMDSVAASATTINNGDVLAIGTYTQNGSFPGWFRGYMEDFRITKGYCRYTGSFVERTLAHPDYFAELDYDPYFSQVVMLQQFDGTHGSSVFTDPGNRSYTLVGSPTISNVKSRFGGTSGYFNGSSKIDYGNNLHDFRMNIYDFTMEAWVNVNAYTGVGIVVAIGTTAGNGGLSLYINSTGTLVISTGSTALMNSNTVKVPLNQWTHIACTRFGTTMTLWINGVAVATITNTWDFTDALCVIGGNASYYFNGWIDSVRVTREVARYTSAFVPSRRAFPTQGPASNSAYDPFWRKVVVASHFDGTDGSTSFTESSSGRSIVTYGAPTLTTANKKFGTASLNLNGTSCLRLTSSNAFTPGSSDFTIEGWVRPSSVTVGKINMIAMFWNLGNANMASWQFRLNGPNLEFQYGVGSGSTTLAGTANGATANVWNHVAVSRHKGWLHLFVNGKKVAQSYIGTSVTLNTSDVDLGIGGSNFLATSSFFAGQIDDFRMTVGVGRYSGQFVPAEFAFPETANGYAVRFPDDTFAAQTTAFVGFDEMTLMDLCGRHDLTVSADVKVGTQSYQRNGAGVFAGSTTSVKLPAGADFEPGTGDFTLEAWVNTTAALIYSNDSTNHTGVIWAQSQTGVNHFVLALTSNNIDVSAMFLFPGGTLYGPNLVSGAWNHVAVVRKNGVITIYVNGVGGTPMSSNYDFGSIGYLPTIGQYSHTTSQWMFSGLIDSVRFTKAARYESAFDPKNAM